MVKNKLVDYAKGFSILAIVMYHLIYYFLNVPNLIKIGANFGGAGVHVFLMCSGFGLYYSYLKHPLTFTEFITKRFKKIYIPYIVIILISFLIPVMYVEKDRLLALLSHIFLFKMFIPRFDNSFGVQMWFISTIIQFYLIFLPLCQMKEKIGNKRFIILSITISLVWAVLVSIIGKSDIRVWNSFFAQYLWEFSIGMLLGEYFKNNQKEFITQINYIFLISTFFASFIIYAFMALKGGPLKVFNDVFSAMAFGSFLVIMYKLNFFKSIFFWINKFSYELYLIHMLVFTISFKILIVFIPNTLTGVISLVIAIMCAIMCAIIMKKIRL